MKTMKKLPVFMVMSMMFLLASCGGEATEGGAEGGDEATVMTTDEFIAEAEELGKEEFEKKYPKDSEIELKGKVVTLAVWGDKVNAKFGTGLTDCPIKSDFMFADNGGDKDSTKEKVKTGEEVHFKGKISFSFFKDDGKLKYVDIKECVAL